MKARSLYVICALVLGGALLTANAPAASTHQLTHQGSGVWISVGFHVTNSHLHWQLQWRCRSPHHMHLNIEKHGWFPFRGYIWVPHRIYTYNGHSTEDLGVRGVFHITPGSFSGSGGLYRLSIHTPCYYEFNAEWN